MGSSASHLMEIEMGHKQPCSLMQAVLTIQEKHVHIHMSMYKY